MVLIGLLFVLNVGAVYYFTFFNDEKCRKEYDTIPGSTRGWVLVDDMCLKYEGEAPDYDYDRRVVERIEREELSLYLYKLDCSTIVEKHRYVHLGSCSTLRDHHQVLNDTIYSIKVSYRRDWEDVVEIVSIVILTLLLTIIGIPCVILCVIIPAVGVFYAFCCGEESTFKGRFRNVFNHLCGEHGYYLILVELFLVQPFKGCKKTTYDSLQ